MAKWKLLAQGNTEFISLGLHYFTRQSLIIYFYRVIHIIVCINCICWFHIVVSPNFLGNQVS